MRHSYDFVKTFAILAAGLGALALCSLPALPFIAGRVKAALPRCESAQAIRCEKPGPAGKAEEESYRMKMDLEESEDVFNGKSPDGVYEARLLRKDGAPLHDFELVLVDVAKRSVVALLEKIDANPGFETAFDGVSALWSEDSKLFAVSCAVERRSEAPHLYVVEGGETRKLKEARSSGFLQNALGRAGLVEIPEICHVEPVSFNGGVLSCKIVFSVDTEEECELYSCDFSLKVFKDSDGSWLFKLDSMSDAKPYDVDGDEMEDAEEPESGDGEGGSSVGASAEASE